TTYTDSGLAAATTYYYRVRAYNAAGNSAYSAIAGATTQEGLPAAPSGLSATAVSASRIDLGWTDNSNNETGFKIDRRRSGTDVWDRIAEPGAGATAYSDSGLPANTLFYYQVKAYNAAGNSAYSGIAGATTQEGLPAAPDGLTATAVSASRVDLGWTDNSNNETGFKIDRRMSHTAAWVRIAETGAGVTSYADSALPAGVKFYYTIKAFNAGGNSAEAGPADATTPGPIAYTAYNDLAWASGQLAVNITTYTRDESGTLKDYATGSALGARLTVNGGGYGPALTQGTNPALETDADSVFGGIVDAAGLISYGDSDLVLTFSGLDPTLRYEVALFGNRAGGYSDRVTTVSLSDASSFANASSAGTQFSGPADASTEINTGENTAEGYLAWYVAIDPGSDGDLVLTLSGYEYANALMLKAVGTPSTPPADFTAYNDLAWFAGQPSANITTYTTTNEAAGRVRSGLLLDYASGRRTDVRLTVDGGLGVFDQGLHPASGTDAHGVFGGKLDAAGTVSYGTEDLTLTFSGLEPTRRYELVLYADRNGAGYVGDNARGHYGTLTEAASFENASTPGTCKVVDVANHQPDDTTLYNAGYNNTAGYVTRFRSIEPGADGTIVLRLKQGAEPTYAAYFGRYYTYANAVMLRTQPDSFLPPDQDADSDAMADAWETAHFGGTDAANGGAQDDFDGDGMSNADEYVAGTDPAGSAAYFAVAVELTGAKIVVSVPTVAASGPAYTGLTRRYAIEQQDVALGAWQAVAGYADFSATGATVAYTNAGAGGATLYRGKVWLREE
ncbi:MAG: fibronectin type III domain-containing protein, partial [Kiritimatiellae bacterium]|nr:fibronectin type III domain-containing protein [Kiritimatiellia bacterium]